MNAFLENITYFCKEWRKIRRRHKNYIIMATLTNEQIEQKKQLLAEKMKQMEAIYDELKDSGIMELSDEELDNITGGGKFLDFFKKLGESTFVYKLVDMIRKR